MAATLTTDRDPRRGLRIALVGNGRGVTKHKKGAKIDAHDLVGRFNFFVTKGDGVHCGSRLDLWHGRARSLEGGPGRSDEEERLEPFCFFVFLFFCFFVFIFYIYFFMGVPLMTQPHAPAER